MNYCFLLLIFLLCPYQLYAQDKTFQLNGTVNADTGTVVLLPTGGEEYSPNKGNRYEAKIKNGTFAFAGKMAYPGSYRVLIRPDYVSGYFLLEQGNQRIVCNVDSHREMPDIDNRIMAAERGVLNTKKTQLLTYAWQHPDSYAALWELVNRMQNGYEPIFDSVYSAFSPTLKTSHTGNVLAQRLASSKATAVGQVFPTLNLLNSGNKPILLSASQTATCTLVDFWFSHCGPCLREFPKLRMLFDTYKSKGFNIAGISIDKPEDEEL